MASSAFDVSSGTKFVVCIQFTSLCLLHMVIRGICEQLGLGVCGLDSRTLGWLVQSEDS
jgi:hypothetical protein